MSEQIYIEKLKIKNFQSHHDTEIEFGPGINVITGTSDAGKTGILRALMFVLYNQSDAGFQTINSDFVEVSVYFSNGTVVTRKKNQKSMNIVSANNDSWDKELKLTNFGRTYDKEIKDALGNPPVFNNEPLAYSDQNSPLYMLGMSPKELSTYISTLIGVEDYAAATVILNKANNSTDKIIKEKKSNVDKYTVDLEEFADLDSKLTKLDNLEAAHETYTNQNNLLKSSTTLKNNIKTTHDRYKDTKNKIENKIKPIVDLEESINILNNNNLQYDNSKKLLVTINHNEKTTRFNKNRLDVLSFVDLDDISEKYNDISNKMSDLSQCKKIYSDIKTNVANTKDAKTSLSKYEDVNFDLLTNQIENIKVLFESYGLAINSKNLLIENQNIRKETKTKIDGLSASIDSYEAERERIFQYICNNNLSCPTCGGIVDENNVEYLEN
jgi:exonuclease SbcC